MELLLPNGTYLKHAGKNYDPQKAHDYYMRTRNLHPRTKGADHIPSKNTVGKHTTTKATPQQLSEQKAYAAQRIAALKTRLAELTAELHKRLASASKSSTKKTPTSTDKQKAAKASKKYRDKHKSEIAAKRKKDSGVSSKSTVELRTEIAHIRLKLKAAVAAQRQLLT